MIDQNSKFFAILTAIGEAKQANADALGIAWLITEMGVGDANGTDPLPDRLQTTLINERRRAPLNQLVTDSKNPGLLMAEQVIPADVGGWWVREIGLYDADGDLIAISNCAPSYKPLLSQGSGRTQIVRMTFIISSTANVVLKIDPSVVIATRDYVDRVIKAVLPPDKTPGDYRQVTVNDRGIVVEGSTPTTLAEYEIEPASQEDAQALHGHDNSKPMTALRVFQATRTVISSISADSALSAEQRGLVLIDASKADRTITLPASIPALGVVDFIVRRTDNSGNRLVIRTDGDDNIKFHTHLVPAGYPFLVLMGAGDWWHLRSDSAGSWWPIGRYDGTPLGRPVFDTRTLFSPGGYGAMNGAELNRADWPWLWDHAQQSGLLVPNGERGGQEGCWTTGNDLTTFCIPEVRGEFLRVLSEGRSVDSDRGPGSWQKGDFEAHVHEMKSDLLGAGGGVGTAPDGFLNQGPSTLGYSEATGGAETRSRNIAYPGRIKLI